METENKTMNLNSDNTLRTNPLVKELRPIKKTPKVYRTLANEWTGTKPKPKPRKKRVKPAKQNKKGSMKK